VALEVTFGPEAVVTLTEDKTDNAVDVQRSIRDLVLGAQSAGEYTYRLRVVRADGTMTCCNRKTAETILWLTPPQVDSCTGDCSDAAGSEVVRR
jgi:hypothetical protein